VGYTPIEELIKFKKGEVVIRNYTMSPKQNEIKQFEVFSTAVKNKDYYLENLKKKSSASIDYISSETMKKTGDNNVTAAISRVSGVSTNGSFITVRGIGDRYLKTNINGLRIPTLDPFTNNIKLDLFPSSLVDNIIITKTASPDLPGDWAGAYISVETKDYPENLAVNIETTFGYNAQTTGKDMLSSERSKTDWLGYDNGYRNVDHNAFVQVNVDPTPYQEMAALGLSSFYASLGINETSAWNDTYYKLGLIELGLLKKSDFYNQTAFNDARSIFNGDEYSGKAFSIINAKAAEVSQKYPNNWDSKLRKAPMNFSQSFSIGNQVKLFGKPLGFLTGFRYGTTIQNDPNAEANRAAVDNNGIVYKSREISQHFSRETNGWSGLVNLSYKPSLNHSISLLFMPNFNGVNNVRNDSEVDFSFAAINNYSKTLFYEQRKQLVYQTKTEHYFPKSKIKVESNASFTQGKSIAPDFKNFSYVLNNENLYTIDKTASNTSRYYRYLDENLLDTKVSAEIPLGKKPGLIRKLKVGGGYQHNDRKNDQYNYIMRFTTGGNYIIENGDISPFFNLNDFALNNNKIESYYERDENPANRTIGNSQIISAFAMADYNINTVLRVSGGLRIEDATIFTDVFAYDSMGLAPNDERRNFPFSIIEFVPNPGNLKELSFLPSINVIYKLRSDEEKPINLRANYSKTVARPSIRELSEIFVYDFELRAPVFGNSALKMVEIDNYDIRLENYFKSGDNLSVSFFYKNFKNHIELVNSNIGYSWQNVDQSRALGIELEGKKQLFKNLEFRSNITITKSASEFVQTLLQFNGGVKTYIPIDTVNRTMFGQAPYVLNGILSYTSDSLGFTATVSYNRQGKRLVIAGGGSIPDIYEIPRNLIDIKLSKNLGKHFAVSLTIRDILNSPIRRTYNFEEGTNIDYDLFRFGTNYQLGIQYKL
jgi:outer membrane receptor for ferrienterochelin and colicin